LFSKKTIDTRKDGAMSRSVCQAILSIPYMPLDVGKASQNRVVARFFWTIEWDRDVWYILWM